MGLTTDDLQQIRTIVKEEARIVVRKEAHTIMHEELDSTVTTRIDPRFDNLEERVEALDNDIKEIYEMISELQKLTRQVAHFEKYDLEQKILKSYKNIMSIAKEAGVKLPEQ